MLAWSGARISEVLALLAASLDPDQDIIAIVTLRRRRRGIVREVLLPPELVSALDRHFQLGRRQASAGRADRRLMAMVPTDGLALRQATLRRGLGDLIGRYVERSAVRLRRRCRRWFRPR